MLTRALKEACNLAESMPTAHREPCAVRLSDTCLRLGAVALQGQHRLREPSVQHARNARQAPQATPLEQGSYGRLPNRDAMSHPACQTGPTVSYVALCPAPSPSTCPSTAGWPARAPSDAATPPVTPIRPRALPVRAVLCCARHAMEPMQSPEDARYAMLVISGAPGKQRQSGVISTRTTPCQSLDAQGNGSACGDAAARCEEYRGRTSGVASVKSSPPQPQRAHLRRSRRRSRPAGARRGWRTGGCTPWDPWAA
jgi:hypothetical protein